MVVDEKYCLILMTPDGQHNQMVKKHRMLHVIDAEKKTVRSIDSLQSIQTEDCVRDNRDLRQFKHEKIDPSIDFMLNLAIIFVMFV